MKRIDGTQKTSIIEGGITRTEGRIGQSSEYVEYESGMVSGVRYAAQKGAFGQWFVFEIYPGKKGSVRTLCSSNDKTSAEIVARRLALGELSPDEVYNIR